VLEEASSGRSIAIASRANNLSVAQAMATHLPSFVGK
jgi:hypothetical protein